MSYMPIIIQNSILLKIAVYAALFAFGVPPIFFINRYLDRFEWYVNMKKKILTRKYDYSFLFIAYIIYFFAVSYSINNKDIVSNILSVSATLLVFWYLIDFFYCNLFKKISSVLFTFIIIIMLTFGLVYFKYSLDKFVGLENILYKNAKGKKVESTKIVEDKDVESIKVAKDKKAGTTKTVGSEKIKRKIDFFGISSNYFSSIFYLFTVILLIIGIYSERRKYNLEKSTNKKTEFERTFFHMLEQHNIVLNEVKRQFIEPKRLLHNDLKEISESVKKDNLILKEDYTDINSYFLILFRVLKHISDGVHNEIFKDLECKTYSSLLRSYLNNKVLTMLAFHLYIFKDEPSFKEYRDYVKKFAFFEHMIVEYKTTSEDISYDNIIKINENLIQIIISLEMDDLKNNDRIKFIFDMMNSKDDIDLSSLYEDYVSYYVVINDFEKGNVKKIKILVESDSDVKEYIGFCNSEKYKNFIQRNGRSECDKTKARARIDELEYEFLLEMELFSKYKILTYSQNIDDYLAAVEKLNNLKLNKIFFEQLKSFDLENNFDFLEFKALGKNIFLKQFKESILTKKFLCSLQ